MRCFSKISMASLAMIVIVAAAPLAAQVAGAWGGVGDGEAYPPTGDIIYPWQNWTGEIPTDEETFSGSWWDADGSHGTFYGVQGPSISPVIAVFSGTWTWENSDEIVKGGEFTMNFYLLYGTCSGTWTSVWPSPGTPGTMKGEKLD